MPAGLLGKKIGMTRIFNEKGQAVPVTVIEVGPCPIVQIKTEETDGYKAVRLGYGVRKPKHTTKPCEGHYKKAGVEPCRMSREFDFSAEDGEFKVGDVLTVDMFAEGEIIDVRGKTKGRGFQGAIKRHGKSRGPESHGSRYHRRVGSIGASASPARVFKAVGMPGHMGTNKIAVQNLSIIRIDKEKNLLLVRGGIPGANGGVIQITRAIKKAKKN